MWLLTNQQYVMYAKREMHGVYVLTDSEFFLKVFNLHGSATRFLFPTFHS